MRTAKVNNSPSLLLPSRLSVTPDRATVIQVTQGPTSRKVHPQLRVRVHESTTKTVKSFLLGIELAAAATPIYMYKQSANLPATSTASRINPIPKRLFRPQNQFSPRLRNEERGDPSALQYPPGGIPPYSLGPCVDDRSSTIAIHRATPNHPSSLGNWDRTSRQGRPQE
jgi:hypothetical protein